LSLRFVDPDLAWKAWRLELIAGGDTRGGALASASLITATRPAFVASASASRAIADAWVEGTPIAYELDTVRIGAGVAPRLDDVTVQVGASARADWLDGAPALVAGPSASLARGDPAATWLRLGFDSNLGAYTHVALSADARAHPSLAGGTLALRAAITHVPTDSPFYRLPTAGGADLLRGAPAGRYRDATVFAAQAEYRHPIVGPLEGALFVDTAAAQGWHMTGGGGLRIVLPPGRLNVTRVDVGVGPGTWGVVAAWGEAF
jgi:hypothetical protein